jgi:alpha-beta hydrolase superfamily lysophospholipase
MNRSEMASLAVALWERGFAVLLFDFLGCGRSDSGWITLGMDESIEVLSACQWCEEKVPGVPRVLVGSSMGGAAAVFALSRDCHAGNALILDSVFHNAVRASLGWWRFLGGLLGVMVLAPTCFFASLWVRKNPWAIHVGRALRKVRCPVLILHGTEDRLTPVKEAEANFEWANEPKRLLVWEGAGHAEMKWLDLSRYVDEVLGFLRETGVLHSK